MYRLSAYTYAFGLITGISLLMVSFQVNNISLENVTHDEAANSLKNTQDYVYLLVAKPVRSSRSPRQRAPPLGT